MKKYINFLKFRLFFFLLSIALIVGGGIVTIVRGGYNLGVDFQAGLELQVQISNTDTTIIDIRNSLTSISGTQVRTLGQLDDSRYIIRVRDDGTDPNFANTISDHILTILRATYTDVEELGSSYVGPRFSTRLARQSILMASLVLLLILLYTWFRFRFGFSIAAIAALVHDTLFMLAFIGAFQIEISTASVAAILTIIGYSLNDTIVIFDRIRENEATQHEEKYITIINTSISQSMSRTLITSLTTLFAVVAIYIFATDTVQNFALNMIVGIFVGTYSSIFIASPTMIMIRGIVHKRTKEYEIPQNATDTADPAAEGQRKVAAPTWNTKFSKDDFESIKKNISAQRRRKKK